MKFPWQLLPSGLGPVPTKEEVGLGWVTVKLTVKNREEPVFRGGGPKASSVEHPVLNDSI